MRLQPLTEGEAAARKAWRMVAKVPRLTLMLVYVYKCVCVCVLHTYIHTYINPHPHPHPHPCTRTHARHALVNGMSPYIIPISFAGEIAGACSRVTTLALDAFIQFFS